MTEEKKQETIEEPKLGIYVCHCGVNIGGVVDIEAVKDYAATLPNVVVAKEYKYMCSDPGQEMSCQGSRIKPVPFRIRKPQGTRFLGSHARTRSSN